MKEKKAPQSKVKKISIIITVVIVLAIIGAVTGGKNDKTEETARSGQQASETVSAQAGERVTEPPTVEVEETEDPGPVIPSSIRQFLEDETLALDFMYACEQIDMKPDRVRNLKSIEGMEQWPIAFTFQYDTLNCKAYCNNNSTVHHISCADGSYAEMYLQGYEPYPYTDFVFDSTTFGTLEVVTERYVKQQLNYPDTAKFQWASGWNYFRNRDLYNMSSIVTAKNAFGVESSYDFSVIYQTDNSNTALVYFMLNGNTLVDSLDSIPMEERQEVPYSGPVDISAES